MITSKKKKFKKNKSIKAKINLGWAAEKHKTISLMEETEYIRSSKALESVPMISHRHDVESRNSSDSRTYKVQASPEQMDKF